MFDGKELGPAGGLRLSRLPLRPLTSTPGETKEQKQEEEEPKNVSEEDEQKEVPKTGVDPQQQLAIKNIEALLNAATSPAVATVDGSDQSVEETITIDPSDGQIQAVEQTVWTAPHPKPQGIKPKKKNHICPWEGCGKSVRKKLPSQSTHSYAHR